MKILQIIACIFLIIITFKMAEMAFWLMSQRSTMFNIAGVLLSCLIIISISILFNKKQQQNEK